MLTDRNILIYRHFLSKQNKDEAIFIKCFDTKEDVASCKLFVLQYFLEVRGFI